MTKEEYIKRKMCLMMEEEDVHVCLKCNSCITGLENYVTHRKSQCPSLTDTLTEGEPQSSKAFLKVPADNNEHLTVFNKANSTQSALIPEDQSSLQEHSQHQKQEFTCPGCRQLFSLELTYLAHVRVCMHIEWPSVKDEVGTSIDKKSTRKHVDSADVIDNEHRDKINEGKLFGQDLDFRNFQPDGKFHCILCKYDTELHTLIRTHVKSKSHTEALHLYVEKTLGKSLNLFTKNADNILICEPCGWQAQHRIEMERHIRERLHHESIMRLVIPDYTIFGTNNKKYQPVTDKGILDVSDYSIKFKATNKKSGTKKDDDVDIMLCECLVKKNGRFCCSACSYSTQRRADMDKHMERLKHVENVELLKAKLKNGSMVNQVGVKKSTQWKLMSKQSKYNSSKTAEETEQSKVDLSKAAEKTEQSKDDSTKAVKESAHAKDDCSKAAKEIEQSKNDSFKTDNKDNEQSKEKNECAKQSEDSCSKKGSRKSSSAPVLENIVKRTRRQRRAPARYTSESVGYFDDEKNELPKKRRCTHRHLDYKEDKEEHKKVLPKKKKCAPRNLDKEKKKEELPKKKRGRPKKIQEHAVPKEKVGRSRLFKWSDFTCEVCDIAFNSKVELKSHVKSNDHKELCDEKKQQVTVTECQLCPSVFLSNSNYDLHLEKHEMDKVFNPNTFRCKACRFAYLSDEALTLHIEKYCPDGDCVQNSGSNEESSENSSEKSKRIYACDLCCFHHKTKKGLMDHLDTMTHEDKACEAAGQEKTLCCGRCGESFYTKRILDAHLEKHTQTHQEFKICPTCGEQVLRNKYKEHCEEAGHSQTAAQITTGYKCNICDKVMSTSSSLADHKYIHSGQRPHKCPMCPFRSRRKADIGIHVKRHLGIKPFKCQQCDSCFVKRSSLTRHIATHNKDRPRPIQCDLCDATFFDRVILRIHKKNLHEYTPPKYLCQEDGCTFGSHTQTDLKGHMRSHTKERPYLCTTCGKSTATKKAMSIHQRVHTGEKPYKCTWEGCGYAARSDTHLRRHRLVHTGEKPYKCPHCDYRSNVQENLRKHVKNSRKHKGMKMYKCFRCNEWEGDSLKEMVNHIRIDHGVYVKRLDVANETGILQKKSGGMEEVNDPVSVEENNTIELESGARNLQVVSIPLMQGNGQSGLDYEHNSKELVDDEEEEEEDDSVEPLSTHVTEHPDQLVIKLGDKVGELLKSLMADGLG